MSAARQGEAAPRAGGASTRWALIALLVLTWVVYMPTLSAGFTNWDDDAYVTANHAVGAGDLRVLVFDPFVGNHHPVTMLSLAAQHALGGLDPMGYHLVNVLLHLASTLLVFLFIAGLLLRGGKTQERSELVALVTAAAFALHPMHVESVAWISARKDTLYTLFFLLALLVYLRHGDRPRTSTLLTTLALGVFAMLSKPAAVVLPLVLLLIDGQRRRALRGAVLLEKVPFFVASLAVGWLTLQAQAAAGATAALAETSLARGVAHASYGVMMYLVRFVAPTGLSPFYPLPEASAELPAVYSMAPIVVLAFVAVAVVSALRGARTATFALAFFAVNLLLVLQLKQVGGAAMADRYTYVPYIGPGLLLGMAVEHWTARRGPVVPLALLGGACALWASLSYSQVQIWTSSETLWARALEVAPSGRAYANRGQLRQQAGDLEGALQDYARALELTPDNVAAHANRGIVLMERGELEAARGAFDRALALEARNAPALVGRALVRRKLGDLEGALADCAAAVAAAPTDAIARGNLGFFRQERGELAAARRDYEAALKLDPSLEVARKGLASLGAPTEDDTAKLARLTRELQGNVDDVERRYERLLLLQKAGRFQEALADCDALLSRRTSELRVRERRCELLAQSGSPASAEAECRAVLAGEPSSIVALTVLGAVQMQQGKSIDALATLDTLLRFHPRDAQALQNRAIVHLGLQRFAEAAMDLQACLELTPTNAELWSNLGALRLRLGELQPAVDAYTRAIALDRTPALRSYRALALLGLGRTKEARDDAQAAASSGVALPPELSALLAPQSGR